MNDRVPTRLMDTTHDDTANTTSVMRAMNERALFERIRQLGPVSRPQLAEATGLSKPTISLALANLERSGLVRHVGRRIGGAGRAALLYELRPDAGWVVAVDVGRSWIRLALANLAGKVVLRRDERSETKTALHLATQIGELVHALTAEASLAYSDLTHIVIGSPGVVDQREKLIRLAPNLSQWDGPGVLEALRKRLGQSFTVENDTNLAALGEQAHGRGRGVANFVLVSIGTGVGMGIVIDGQLYRGARGAAGEIGYLPLGEGDPVAKPAAARRRGMLESVAAADGIVATAHRLGMGGRVTAKQVFEAARQGERKALAAVRIEAEHLARAVAAVSAVLDPELVILAGGIGRNGDLLIPPMAAGLRQLLRSELPAIEVSALGDDAVVLGALATALSVARQRVLAKATGG
jgi:predicted NBD/HSP70 family sugar kinase